MNKRKGNKSLNIYADGGFAKFLNKSGNSLFGSTGDAASEVGKWGLTLNGMGIANMGAGLASSIGGSLVNNNDLHTGAGDIMNTVGGLASNIPGVGGIIGAGVGLLGSVTNAAFGSKLNHQFINLTENKIDYLMALNFDDYSADSLASDWNNLEMLDNVSRSQIGKDGWFSRKAKRRARKLNKLINRSNEFAVDTFDNAAENLGQNTLNGHLSNYFAKGGNLNKDYPPNQPLLSQWTDADLRHSDNIKGQNSFNEFLYLNQSLNNMKNNIFDLGGALLGPNIGGASHGADFSSGVKFIKNGGTHELNPNLGVPIGVDQEGNPNLVEEGEVVFNDYVYSNRILADKKFLESTNLDKKYSGKTYAYIAEKLTEESSERENDPISLNGLHANMGKLMAALELQKLEDEMSKMTEMFDKMKNLSEEDAVQLAEDMGLFGQEELLEYSDEMGNQIMPEDMSQEVPQGELILPRLAPQLFALGGLTNNRNDLYNRYLKSDYARELQLGNLDIGDFNRFKTDAPVPRMFDILRRYGNMSLEDKSKAGNHMPTFDANSTKNVIRLDIKYGKSVAERFANIMNPYQWSVPQLNGNSNLPVDKQTTDVIEPKANTTPKGGSYGDNTKNPVRSIMDNILGPTLNGLGLQLPSVPKDMKFPQYFAPPVSSKDSRGKGSSLANMRYAPILGNISSVIQDKFNKPDYSAVDKIETAIKPVQKVTNPRLNDYMTYSPLDTDYLTNKLDLQQASNRSNIRNMSGGNRATAVAGLMASDSAHNSQRGELFRLALDYNNAQRLKVSEFNRTTNQYNADSAYRTTATNALNTLALNQLRLGAYTSQAQLKDLIDTKLSAAKSSNLSNLFNNLGMLGKEEASRNMISSNPSLGYYLSRLNELSFKGYGGNK